MKQYVIVARSYEKGLESDCILTESKIYREDEKDLAIQKIKKLQSQSPKLYNYELAELLDFTQFKNKITPEEEKEYLNAVKKIKEDLENGMTGLSKTEHDKTNIDYWAMAENLYKMGYRKISKD